LSVFQFFGRPLDFWDGGTAACAGFPAWWPTAVLGRHATGDGPSAGGASGIRGTHAEGERGADDRGSEGVNELSAKVLKTRVIY
jgi:hypothetical protein